ncbi:MAG: hypothetical protein EP319_07155 [Deltaproteobacteria bacterium]|nr:MAG: hypothetical protein EP319_07155 [Deltaproteobacteria bacterium]
MILTLLNFLIISVQAATLGLDSSVLDNSSLKQLSHRGDGPFSTYLSMDIQYSPIKELWKQTEIETGLKLNNRGEAHITTITPPEYFHQLKGVVTIEEIEEIASKMPLQASRFKVVCLGRGIKDAMSTYYIVVESDDLINLRKKVEMLFLKKGGEKGKFKAENFYPHITVGFTKRDLHESDGVIKDKKSCFKDIKLR